MQETKELEKIIEEIIERRPDIILKALRNFLPSDIVTRSDFKLLVDSHNKRFEDLLNVSEKQFEAINKRFEDMNKRFDETITLIQNYFKMTEQRFEDINRRFEENLHYSEKQFEAVNKRFESMDRRFEEMMHYTDRKFDILVKIIFGFNVPILVGIIAILIKSFLM